jgi:hypothetical protein
MFKRSFQLVLVICALTGASTAVSDPFVGVWKLNPSKSTLTDVMKVESVANNRFAFDFGAGALETIMLDGTDQPGYGGTTLSVTIQAPDAWKVVRKKDGRMLVTANWKLSKDGKTLADDFTSIGPNGSTLNVNYVYKRTAGTTGFPGTWVSTSERINSEIVFKVEPYQGDGLSFIDPAQKQTTNVKFDGKNYAMLGPNVPPGLTAAALRLNPNTLEMTHKLHGKIVDTRQAQVSPDLKTMTMTVRKPGLSRYPDILVFERQ